MPGNLFQLAITVYDTDGTTPKENVKVTVRNESTNETLTDDSDSSGQVIFQLANLDSGWNSGNIISYYTLYSGYEASGSFTVTDTGGVDKTLTLVALTVAPSLRYFTVQEFYDYFDIPQYDDDPENGLRPQTIVKIGEMVEKDIDQITNRIWDNNGGDYHTITNEYHNSKGVMSGWPASIDAANPTTQMTFFARFAPIKTLTSFQINQNAPSTTANWVTLTEEDNEISLRESLARIQIVDTSKYPAAGKDQVRLSYTCGEDETPADIKQLAIMKVAMALAGGRLQRLNINVSEAEGLSSAIQNLQNFKPEIDRIVASRRYPRIRRI